MEDKQNSKYEQILPSPFACKGPSMTSEIRVGKDQYGLEYLGKAIEREETRLNLKGKLCTGRWLPRSITLPSSTQTSTWQEILHLTPGPVAEPGGRFPMKWRETQCQWCKPERNVMLLPKFPWHANFLMPHLQCKDAESVTILTNHI